MIEKEDFVRMVEKRGCPICGSGISLVFFHPDDRRIDCFPGGCDHKKYVKVEGVSPDLFPPCDFCGSSGSLMRKFKEKWVVFCDACFDRGVLSPMLRDYPEMVDEEYWKLLK